MHAALLAVARFVVAHPVGVGTFAFLAMMFAWKIAAKAIILSYGWPGFVITLALMFALGFLVERRFPKP